MGVIIEIFFPSLIKKEEETEEQRIKRIKNEEIEKYGEIDEIFRNNDSDGSGQLGESEFIKSIYNYIELHRDKEQALMEQIKEINFQADTTISLYEFRALIACFTKDDIDILDIIEVYKLFDKNLTGQIGSDELIHVMNKLGLNLSVSEADELIKEADNNGDNVIDFEEFVKIMLAK